MSCALRIRPMCLAYQKWCPAWRQNKTCESFARRVSRIYRATSNRADYRIIINWNVTSGQRVILLYIIFIYFVIIWLHLIFTLPLPRTLVHCQLLIGMQTAVNIVGKVARICAMFWFMIMQNESRSQGLSNHWFIVWSPYFFFFGIFGHRKEGKSSILYMQTNADFGVFGHKVQTDLHLNIGPFWKSIGKQICLFTDLWDRKVLMGGRNTHGSRGLLKQNWNYTHII